MKYTLRGARVVDAMVDLPGASLTVDDGRITAVGPEMDAPGDIVDVSDSLVMPGFIDVHTHGGGGHNLHTTDADEILAYARWAPTTGVTGFLVGVVGTPETVPEAQLAAAAEAIGRWGAGARPLGIHLEGPYINVLRRGAHHPSWLRHPDPAETERVLSLAGGHLRLVTLAPELAGGAAMIRRLVEAGVTVSIGHTDASYEQALEAIEAGVTHATHCYNAMRPLLHRDPGPLGAVAECPQVYGEVIADGVHVHPAVVYALVRMLGPQRTIVITDALAAAGMADASFEFAGQPAHVTNGAARLVDGTITGSVLTMDQALRNVVSMARVTLPEAIAMLTHNPARAAGVADRKGRLVPGYDADLLLLDESLTLQATIQGGELVYATRKWQSRLRQVARARITS